MNKFLNILLFLCFLILVILVLIKAEGINSDFFNQNKLFSDIKNPQINVLNDNIVKIKINQPTPLSYKTKAEVLEQRKKYVADSIFASDNYEPSEEVFGQIEDGKPWVSMNGCRYNNEPAITEGPSEETRFLNNPSILAGIEYPYYLPFYQNNPQCTKIDFPFKAEYNQKQKEITVYYKDELLKYAENKYIINEQMLEGTNARDLGYPYAYVDLQKSENIRFPNESNISNSIAEFQNFIHVGGSCAVEGGCNNGSPRQEELIFQKEKLRVPAVIYIKLWKNRPLNPSDPADITEKIIVYEK